MQLVTGLLGVLGTAVGAALSYVLGARAALRAGRLELFQNALQAVAIMRSTRVHPAHIAQSALGPADNESLTREMLIMRQERHSKAILEAQEALAKLEAYWPGASEYREPWHLSDADVSGLLDKIKQARDRRLRRLRR